MNSSQAKRYLAKKGATFAPGKGGHLIVTLDGTKEIGKGIWLAILKPLDIKD